MSRAVLPRGPVAVVPVLVTPSPSQAAAAGSVFDFRLKHFRRQLAANRGRAARNHLP